MHTPYTATKILKPKLVRPITSFNHDITRRSALNHVVSSRGDLPYGESHALRLQHSLHCPHQRVHVRGVQPADAADAEAIRLRQLPGVDDEAARSEVAVEV